jgi:hypothetical protein
MRNVNILFLHDFIFEIVKKTYEFNKVIYTDDNVVHVFHFNERNIFPRVFWLFGFIFNHRNVLVICNEIFRNLMDVIDHQPKMKVHNI